MGEGDSHSPGVVGSRWLREEGPPIAVVEAVGGSPTTAVKTTAMVLPVGPSIASKASPPCLTSIACQAREAQGREKGREISS